MRSLARWGLVAATVVTVGGSAIPAFAQMPVCPAPDPRQLVFTACAANSRFAVAAFLAELAIDQLLNPGYAAIERVPRTVFASVATPSVVEQQAALAEWVGRLAPVKLTRLDTATGTLRLDVAEGDRRFAASIDAAGVSWKVEFELPAQVEGGYWRTPGVLQMAFWNGKRVHATFATPGGVDISVEVGCVVLSPDGARIVTVGEDVPDILVRLDSCG